MIEPHALADLIPLPTDAEYDALAQDIRNNGLLEPAWLFEGKILDGRTRQRACTEVGVPLTTRTYGGTKPVAFVISQNVKRRHLTLTQRAALAVAMEEPLARENRRHAQEVATAAATAARRGESPSGPVEPDGGRESKSARMAGEAVGVSATTVKRAKRLRTQAPELWARVEAGKLSLAKADDMLTARRKADKQAARPVDEQRAEQARDDREVFRKITELNGAAVKAWKVHEELFAAIDRIGDSQALVKFASNVGWTARYADAFALRARARLTPDQLKRVDALTEVM